MSLGEEHVWDRGSVHMHNVITDRGSVYSVTADRASSRADVEACVRAVRARQGDKPATHTSFAVRILREGVIYETAEDDGEVGAGNVILREMQKADVVNVCVCVSRWFGGTRLERDRYAHIQNATRAILNSNKENVREV